MIDFYPAIAEQTPGAIEQKLTIVQSRFSWVQIDMSDGTLEAKPTYMDMDRIAAIISSNPAISFEAHLVMAHPEKYIIPVAKAGCKRLIAHIESVDPRVFLEEVQYESVETGLAIDATTELDAIEPFLDAIDTVLVMTAEIGSPSQSFFPETVEKVKRIKEHYPDITISAEGGLSEVSIQTLRDAGVNRMIIGEQLYSNSDAISHIDKLLRLKE